MRYPIRYKWIRDRPKRSSTFGTRIFKCQPSEPEVRGSNPGGPATNTSKLSLTLVLNVSAARTDEMQRDSLNLDNHDV